MPLQWSLPGALGTAAYVLTWALAALVYFARPDRRQNRSLALLLVTAGSFTFFLRSLRLFLDDPTLSFASFLVAVCTAYLLPFAYAAFLGTLPTRWAAPFRAKGVLPALLVLGVAAAAYSVAAPAWLYVRVEPYPFLDAWSVIPTRALLNSNLLTLVLPPFVALAVAVVSVWHAPTPTSRRRAVAFAWAFGVHDAIMILEFGTLVAFPAWMDATRAGNYVQLGGSLARAILLPALLSYGILRTQLFDIELKVKWTIRQSTLVAVFLGAFFVAFAIAEQWLQQYGVVVGGLAVGLLLFALRPLERAAERLADRAMPGVEGTPEYLAFRKLEVYKAALESAAEDGVVTEKERAVLATLRARLGIAAADAEAMERDVAAAARPSVVA